MKDGVDALRRGQAVAGVEDVAGGVIQRHLPPLHLRFQIESCRAKSRKVLTGTRSNPSAAGSPAQLREWGDGVNMQRARRVRWLIDDMGAARPVSSAGAYEAISRVAAKSTT